MRLFLLPLVLLALPATAAEPRPEIERPAATAQAVGARHTLRTIPEACARIEGRFTGQAADPYRFDVVRTSPACQPRARFVDSAEANPSTATGWIFNDLIRVPSAGCPSQQAVVRVWRKPGSAVPPELDAQGRARVYLDARQGAASAATKAQPPVFAAALTVEGRACD